MLLRHYLQRGVSKAALARRFGVSRRTIHEWVETGQLDRDLASGGARYAPRPAVPHKLAPYTGIIEARLEEFPGLSAQRLFDEVRAAGSPGGYSRVRDYVRAVRPREPVEAVVRFETPPGRQGQVDVATFTLPWGRRHALVVVLSHSRLLWLRFYRRQTMAVLTEGLERAFARFGGVPKELLFDQMRAVVLSDGRVGGGELVLNAECLRVAAHWGFHPRACRPYRTQTKGKVERPIRYIRDSFLYGRAFANDEDLNEQASRWLEGTANVRRHSTTGERPVNRVERDEREALGPLARRPYQRVGVQPATEPTRGVGAQPFDCDEAAVGSLATVTAAGARSRHEIKGPSEVQDEVSRGELVSVRAGLGPARGRDAVALCRRHGRVAPGAVRSTRRAEAVLGLCDRDGVDAPPCLPVALAPSGRLLAVGLVVAGCRSRSPRPHHALPTQSVSRGCIPPHPIERTHPSHRRQHGTVDCGRRRMGCGETRWTRPPRLEEAASCC